MLWRFDKGQPDRARGLNAHIVDMAEFVTGQEVSVWHRRAFVQVPQERKHASTVDDVVVFLATFAGGTALRGPRLAHGHHRGTLEANGRCASTSRTIRHLGGTPSEVAAHHVAATRIRRRAADAVIGCEHGFWCNCGHLRGRRRRALLGCWSSGLRSVGLDVDVASFDPHGKK